MEDGLEDPLLVSTPAGPPPAVAGAAAGGGRGAGVGRLGAVLSADYYNRPLSGWEPVVEPWRSVHYGRFRENNIYHNLESRCWIVKFMSCKPCLTSFYCLYCLRIILILFENDYCILYITYGEVLM